LFDQLAAKRAELFFPIYLRHVKGELAGERFELAEWQRERIIRPLFGWKRPDGTRRYRVVYVEVPKKNGKSLLAAGLCLLFMAADGEPGAEVYCVASDREQAGIVFDVSKQQVEDNPRLSSRMEVYTKRIVYPDARSFLHVLSGIPRGKHGFNPHAIVFDEFHEQTSWELYETLTKGRAARRQPVIVMITTAGFDRETPCFEMHEKARGVLGGTLEADDFLPVIFGADEADDWKAEPTWTKANPGLGSSVKLDYLREECAAAAGSIVRQNSFRRLHLNQWTSQETRWLDMDLWATNAGPVASDLAGRSCYAGLDLSSTSDFSALALVFAPEESLEESIEAAIQLVKLAPTSQDPAIWDAAADLYQTRRIGGRHPASRKESPEIELAVERLGQAVARGGGLYHVLPFFWFPEENVGRREKRHGLPRETLEAWAKGGWLTLTDGNVIDYEVIRAKVNELRQLHDIREIAIDRWNATGLSTQLQGDGFEVTAFGQGYMSMSGPTKMFERLVIAGKIRHGDNPILSWMAGNAAVQRDAADNLKPAKHKSGDRIDGIVAAVMGLGLAQAQDSGSIYDRSEVKTA